MDYAYNAIYIPSQKMIVSHHSAAQFASAQPIIVLES